jgi:hypothetical protein
MTIPWRFLKGNLSPSNHFTTKLIFHERGEFSHEFILKAITAGEVALIHAPPERTTTHSANDHRQIWMRQYLCLTPFTAKRALEIGVQAFHSKYDDTSESELPQRMETEILTDLSSMQRQPAIMKDYRRYVVFISEKEATSSSNSGGVQYLLRPSLFEDETNDLFSSWNGLQYPSLISETISIPTNKSSMRS